MLYEESAEMNPKEREAFKAFVKEVVSCRSDLEFREPAAESGKDMSKFVHFVIIDGQQRQFQIIPLDEKRIKVIRPFDRPEPLDSLLDNPDKLRKVIDVCKDGLSLQIQQSSDPELVADVYGLASVCYFHPGDVVDEILRIGQNADKIHRLLIRGR